MNLVQPLPKKIRNSPLETFFTTAQGIISEGIFQYVKTTLLKHMMNEQRPKSLIFILKRSFMIDNNTIMVMIHDSFVTELESKMQSKEHVPFVQEMWSIGAIKSNEFLFVLDDGKTIPMGYKIDIPSVIALKL
jgi:hypothetical protein